MKSLLQKMVQAALLLEVVVPEMVLLVQILLLRGDKVTEKVTDKVTGTLIPLDLQALDLQESKNLD